MLVVTRKYQEQLIIAGNIRVKILAVEGNRVRLGIEAPDDVRIERSETIPPLKLHLEELRAA